MNGFLEILNRLHDAGSEFVIVGGVAAALHGGTRVTFDLDIVPSLEPDPWQLTVSLLWELGARPRIPEPLSRILDTQQVRHWRKEKGMLALNFRTPDATTEVDLLVSESERFDELRERSIDLKIGRRTFHVVSLDDLIEMKVLAGRPQDILDVAELKAIKLRTSEI